MPRNAIKLERLPLPPELNDTPISHCCEAWNRRFQTAVAEGRGVVSCSVRANEAYRLAMPPLTSPENIRDFISCVTHGLLFGTIIDAMAKRLLYAAQVASAAYKSVPGAAQTRGRKTAVAATDSTSGDSTMPSAG